MSALSTLKDQCFTPFKSDIGDIELPAKFTYPFCYQPHELSQLAAKELQEHLLTQTFWQHDFSFGEPSKEGNGKMFGVLVVINQSNELGYLSAFSGKISDRNLLPHFVPPVFDMLTKDSFFLTEQALINQINDQVDALESNPKIAEYAAKLADIENSTEQLIELQRAKIIVGRKSRKSRRQEASQAVKDKQLSEQAFEGLLAELGKESVFEKNELKALKQHCDEQISAAKYKLMNLTDEIAELKNTRRQHSNDLQQRLFEQYRFLNAKGEYKNLQQLFKDMPHPPPAGAGDCAAPKLLHFAFEQGLTPIAMAEFWWGAAPKSEIRQHQNYYPACLGKCQPILSHMLLGLSVEENPLLNNPALNKTLEIVYQDDDIVVVNKPAEFLSVPGKNIKDSVYHRIKAQFPDATGNYIIHRLDMSTSGLMVLSLTKRAQKSLQQQFITRAVKKRYVALIDGLLAEDQGEINLPLIGDYYDRPRQMVCFDEGKPAKTQWQVVERTTHQTKVFLHPTTGRTHQLRVHCAHQLGLNMPIIGDDLYGVKGERLHLHAQRLELNHPITKQLLVFEVDADF
ncbi:RluA family pseudouridine synthase [Thalassotalea atypica]|uniref:RluA family pseudouridine synthase n=1 Tax=Thalassotalea atypica TaxID=2054316 RepID=UPI0025735159|nr:RluA family pseudouridine synthase [Thalassotalea atypica]